MNKIQHIETVSGESQTDFNNTLALTIERLQNELNLDVEIKFSTSQNTHTKKNTSLIISSTVYSALLIGRVKEEVITFNKPVEFYDANSEDVEVIENAELIN